MPDDNKDAFDQPVLIEAHTNDNDLFLILSGHIYIMDSTGMYGYGILKSGSYFGDISILLNQPNCYSYFYNPFSEKPLQLLKIKRKDFLYICSRYPVEHEIWKQRAQKREELFESYKTLNLLKYMKAILKKPRLIKEINVMYDGSLKLLNRITSWREQYLKLAMLRHFLFQYEIRRRINYFDSLDALKANANEKKQGKHRNKIDVANEKGAVPVQKNTPKELMAKDANSPSMSKIEESKND